MDCYRHRSPVHPAPARALLYVLSLLIFLPMSLSAQVKSHASKPTDVPSGFLPGLIQYFAGNGTSTSGSYSDGSSPTAVPLGSIGAVAADSLGNVYIAQSGTIYVVYRGGAVPKTLQNITGLPGAGLIYQIAGLSSNSCSADPDPTCGEGKPLNKASFSNISSLTFDSSDNLYICDSNSFVVRKVDAGSSIVSTVVGQLNVSSSSPDIGDGGPATRATLNFPNSVAVDSLGNVYINDLVNYVVRVVYATGASAPPPILAAEGITSTSTPAAKPGFIYTVAGQAQLFCSSNPTFGSSGSPGGCGDFGPANSSSDFLFGPNSVAVDAVGNVYIADAYSGSAPAFGYIRVVYAGGTVPPLLSLALDPSGAKAVSPKKGYIYAATGYGSKTQFAICSTKPCGDGGLAADVEFGPTSVYLSLIVDAAGNLYVSDPGDFSVRKIDTSGYASTVTGIDDPTQSPPTTPATPGGPATSTQLSNNLSSIAFDPQNNLYVGDIGDSLVWQVAALLPQQIDFPALDPVTYGVSAIALTATATSGLPVAYSIVSGPATLSGSKLIVTGSGSVVIAASQGGDDQYAAASPVTQTLTVDPALLTVTADNASKLFGQPNPPFSANFSGFVNGDTAAGAVSGEAAFSTTATTTSAVGSYPITISQGSLSSSKYNFTFVQGATLTITGSTPQTITFAPPASVVYGASPTVTLTASATSGLPVSFTVVSGPATNAAGGALLAIAGGGTVVITATQKGDATYQAAPPVTQNLIINPAPLTVTAPTLSLPYGKSVDPTTLPAATITGFVGTDNASLVAGSAHYSLSVKGKPDVGSYPISVTQGSLTLLPGAAQSYALSIYVPGTLTILAAPQTVTFNPLPPAQTYGNALQLTAVSSSGLPVTFSASGASSSFPLGNVTDPGSSVNSVNLQISGIGALTVTASQSGGGNYAPATVVSQTLSVGQAPLNIQAYPPQVREQGANNPVFPYTIGVAPAGEAGGFVNNDSDIPAVITGVPVLTTTATPDSAPGTYTVVPSQGTLAATNYYFVFINGQLTVTPPGSFTIGASPASLTIPPGRSGQATLSITPVNAYQGTVTLSCGQLPANVSCTISPSTFVFPGSQNPDGSENVAQGTVTVVAAGATVVGDVRPSDSNASVAGFLIPGALSGLLVLWVRRRAANRIGIWSFALAILFTSGLFAITACGGSSKVGAASSGTSTVMIMGSGTSVSGGDAVTSSTALSVTIQ